jgi:phosphoribosylanthranilate isomerase
VTRVKVCGITNVEDAHRAAELGAWAIGLIFHGDSPRAVDLASAQEIGAELKRKTEVVGVFCNHPLDEVVELADACSLTILQLHGEEGPAYAREAGRRTGAKVMKAIRVKDASSLQELHAYREVDFHMLDAYVPGTPGGTGQTFEWELASKHRGPVPLVLSGGLSPDNVAEAIAAVHPFAVDSASGTEAEPGRKDPGKLSALFREVERASREAA